MLWSLYAQMSNRNDDNNNINKKMRVPRSALISQCRNWNDRRTAAVDIMSFNSNEITHI